MSLFAKAPPDPDAQNMLGWLRLFRTQNIGPITFYKLIETFGSASEALHNLPTLSQKAGRKKPLTPPPAAQIEKEYARLQKLGGGLICTFDESYPLALSALDDAPPVLSYLGHTSFLNKQSLGIVGARNASLNGKKFASKLAKELGESGQTIISGLARGIDTAAHEGALNTGTIAVVAGGIDVVYPRENQKLYEQIKEHGLILAESPLGMEPIARHFPKRNRIVSGLSDGIVVIEATIKSGSLITARLAGEQGRDVYAVPGYPGDPRAQGPNKLIQDGAVLVQSAEDILRNLNSFTGGKTMQEPPQVIPFTPPVDDEKESEEIKDWLLSELSSLPSDIDEIARSCGVSIQALQMPLLELELAGRIERLPSNRVCLLDS